MIPIDEPTLAQVARDVCDTMLCMTSLPASQLTLIGPRLAAWVQISGECDLKIEIETVRELACDIACRMFSTTRENVDDSDVRDALGEVANMIGGNVKGILSGELDLSLPVVDDRDGESTEYDSNGIVSHLKCDGFPMIVRLLALSRRAVTA